MKLKYSELSVALNMISLIQVLVMQCNLTMKLKNISHEKRRLKVFEYFRNASLLNIDHVCV